MEFSLGNLEQIEIPLKPKPTIKIAGEGGYQLTYRGEVSRENKFNEFRYFYRENTNFVVMEWF